MLATISVTFLAGAILGFRTNAKVMLLLVPFVAVSGFGVVLADGDGILWALVAGSAMAVAFQMGYFGAILIQAATEAPDDVMAAKRAMARFQGTRR